MKSFALVCVICLQMGWSYSAKPASNGVAAVAYQDSAGNRYGGTYGLNGEQVVHFQGFPFAPQPYPYLEDFAPEYFRNLENILQEAFYSNIRNQQIAFNAARKAFDLTSNHVGYFQPFPSRFQPSAADFPSFPGIPAFPSFPDFPTISMPNFAENTNSAFASAAVMPGLSHQIAAISPSNPDQPNINKITQFSDTSNPGSNHYSVSSSSYATSSNVNGKQVSSRGAETTVDNNGKVVTYKVQS